jgi:SAM-dependent methyltransferase
MTSATSSTTVQLLVFTAAAVPHSFTKPHYHRSVFGDGEAYESFMGRWSRRLAPLLVQFAGVADGDSVLDVGSGTGSLAAAVAANAPGSRVVGVDRSESYVAVARARHQSQRMRFEVGDAQQLPFQDASFDRTLSLLILNFVPDPQKALTEMIRVTRVGGIVAAAVWDYAEGMEMLRVFWDEAIGLDPRADPYDERHMPFSRAGELSTLWRSHHLQNVDETPLTIETQFSSFENYWSPFLQQQGPAGAHVAALSANGREQLQSKLRQRLMGDRAEEPITLRARAWAVRGVVARAATRD